MIYRLTAKWAALPGRVQVALIALIIMLESTWGAGCGPTR